MHQEDPRKRPDMTGPAKDDGKAGGLNAKARKEHELQTKH